MRRVLQVVGLASAVLVSAACGDAAGPVDEEGTFTATWAGNSWNGTGGAYISGNVLHIWGTKGPNKFLPLETVSAEITSPAAGTFALEAGKASFSELIGGDVLGSAYRTTSQAGGSVTITRYDGVGGIVEGSISFDAELTYGTGSYGQSNRLQNGQFSVPVVQATLPQ